MRVAVVFPGQGSQRPGWGGTWAADGAPPPVEGATRVLGGDVVDRLLFDPDADVSSTEAAQMSILLASLALWDRARAWLAEVEVVAVGGHSLGQITGLLACDVVDRERGLELAAARARASAVAQAAHPGRMVALFPTDEDTADAVAAAVPGRAWLANANGAGQLVIGCEAAVVDEVVAAAGRCGVRRVQPLPVDGAFHTPLMASAGDAVAGLAATMAFAAPAHPLLDNLDGGLVRHARGWPDRLARHLVAPVRWDACLATLAAQEPDLVVELGPSPTLAPLLRRSLPGAAVRPATTADEVDALATLTRDARP